MVGEGIGLAGAVDIGGAIAIGVIGLGKYDHNWTWERHGKQEGDAANTLEGSEGPATVWW